MAKYNYHKDHTEPKQAGMVFVFGSNLGAHHGGGAAKLAEDKYGASRKIAEGMSGMSYALPTKDKKIVTLPINTVKEHVKRFIRFAKANPDMKFFMTRVGCVLAGFTNADIAPMFKGSPTNINFPEEWALWLEASES